GSGDWLGLCRTLLGARTGTRRGGYVARPCLDARASGSRRLHRRRQPAQPAGHGEAGHAPRPGRRLQPPEDCRGAPPPPARALSHPQPRRTAIKRLLPVTSVTLNNTAGRPASFAAPTRSVTSWTVATWRWLTSRITCPGSIPFSSAS